MMSDVGGACPFIPELCLQTSVMDLGRAIVEFPQEMLVGHKK